MKKASTNKFFVYLMVSMTALLIIAAIVAASLLVQLSEIEKERAELKEKIEQLYAEKELRENDLEYQNTLDWATKRARALGLIREDEEIWKAIDK